MIESANAIRGRGSRRDREARRNASSLPRSGNRGGGRARTHLATADGPGDLERAGRGAKRRALSKNRRGGERSDVKVGGGVGGRVSPTGRGAGPGAPPPDAPRKDFERVGR